MSLLASTVYREHLKLLPIAPSCFGQKKMTKHPYKKHSPYSPDFSFYPVLFLFSIPCWRQKKYKLLYSFCAELVPRCIFHICATVVMLVDLYCGSATSHRSGKLDYTQCQGSKSRRTLWIIPFAYCLLTWFPFFMVYAWNTRCFLVFPVDLIFVVSRKQKSIPIHSLVRTRTPVCIIRHSDC